jgi:hypothetical protein
MQVFWNSLLRLDAAICHNGFVDVISEALH